MASTILDNFYPGFALQEKSSNKLRVLLEGQISVQFKGVADAYNAVAPSDCEIWIVSSSGYSDSSWRYDRMFEKLDYSQKMAIYSS